MCILSDSVGLRPRLKSTARSGFFLTFRLQDMHFPLFLPEALPVFVVAVLPFAFVVGVGGDGGDDGGAFGVDHLLQFFTL